MAADLTAIDGDAFDPLDEPEERRVLYAAIDSFRQYRRAAHFNVTHLRRQSFYSLPTAQVELLSTPPFTLTRTFDAVDKAIDANASISEAILEHGLAAFGLGPEDTSWHGEANPHDIEKAQSTIRQLYRDWSAEGLPERNASHSPIFSALATHLGKTEQEHRDQVRILVPGAGLGRLVFDLCAAGYMVEGNEISYHQLLASNYILNFCNKAGQHELYPWALIFSNHLARDHQLRAYAIPDIHPSAVLADAAREDQNATPFGDRMSMTSGDFCVLYTQVEYAEMFDAVTTCFFIDTAPNVILYIEAVRRCLKPNGLWINVGPLLWHFESTPTPAEREKQKAKLQGGSEQRSHASRNDGIGEPGSFELTNEEVLLLLARSGFEVIERGESAATGYIQNPASMLQNVYRPTFWTARKVGA